MFDVVASRLSAFRRVLAHSQQGSYCFDATNKRSCLLFRFSHNAGSEHMQHYGQRVNWTKQVLLCHASWFWGFFRPTKTHTLHRYSVSISVHVCGETAAASGTLTSQQVMVQWVRASSHDAQLYDAVCVFLSRSLKPQTNSSTCSCFLHS